MAAMQFRDTLDARLSSDVQVRRSVFAAQSGKRAVVLVNPVRWALARGKIPPVFAARKWTRAK